MERTIEENKALCEKMPYLIPKNCFTGQISEDYDYSWTELDVIDDGWRLLFLMLNEEIYPILQEKNLLHSFQWTQIKEKYGHLCAYNAGAPQEVHDIICKYEYLSKYICSRCGKPVIDGTRFNAGWIENMCQDCYVELRKSLLERGFIKNFNKEEELRQIQEEKCDKPIKKGFYIVEHHSDGTKTRRWINVSKTLKKYIERWNKENLCDRD